MMIAQIVLIQTILRFALFCYPIISFQYKTNKIYSFVYVCCLRKFSNFLILVDVMVTLSVAPKKFEFKLLYSILLRTKALNNGQNWWIQLENDRKQEQNLWKHISIICVCKQLRWMSFSIQFETITRILHAIYKLADDNFRSLNDSFSGSQFNVAVVIWLKSHSHALVKCTAFLNYDKCQANWLLCVTQCSLPIYNGTENFLQ